MKEVKCHWCKIKDPKESMEVEEKGTGKFNKNGSEKKQRKYFHLECYQNYLKDKEFKEQELKELDALYQYLIKLHKLEALDGRMIERIQDFRNGTIKVKNQKIKKYKNGVTYSKMLQTYQFIEDKLNKVYEYKHLEPGWQEFTYFFGTMVNSLNEVQHVMKKQAKETALKETVVKKNIETQSDYPAPLNKKKKDELDISNFL